MKPILIKNKPTIQGLVKFEREFSEEHGPFVFLGFLWPEYYAYDEDASTRPYVAAAAPWSTQQQSSADNKAVREAFYEGVGQVLKIERWLWRPDSTLLDPAHSALDPILDALEVEHDLVELVNVELFGREMRRAYIITSQRLESPAALSED